MRASILNRERMLRPSVASQCQPKRIAQAVITTRCRAFPREAKQETDNVAPEGLDWTKRLASAALGATTALSLLLSPPLAASELVRLPASTDPAVFAAQQTLAEAWTIVGRAFVDTSFNGHDWEGELRQHMLAAYAAPSGEAALGEIGAMLEDLGDPYTRRVPPEEYASFRMSSEGELQGVGMLIANEPTAAGNLLVLAPIKGGPADRAGILPGDEVLSINGLSMEGWNGEKAARLLRGKGGTEVRVRLARRSGGIPGVPARPDPRPSHSRSSSPFTSSSSPSAPVSSSASVEGLEVREVSLKRERVQLSPLFHAALPPLALPPGTGTSMPVGPDGRVRPTRGPVGYLRLTSFAANAAAEMRDAIQELEAAGVSSYILDLRNNPGGLVRASIDIARLWMDGSPVAFNISGREPEDAQSQLVDSPGSALTHRPLVVLVNGGSASASEILSGALHDNHRALIVGDGHTYGKGRIQSVFELQDGSALFVTVARYQTPAGTEIDRVGLNPDRACTLPTALALPSSASSSSTAAAAAGSAAATFVPGLPLLPGSEEALVDSLLSDGCVVAAREALQREVAVVANAAAVAAEMPTRGTGRQAALRPAALSPGTL